MLFHVGLRVERGVAHQTSQHLKRNGIDNGNTRTENRRLDGKRVAAETLTRFVVAGGDDLAE